ncbi:MAG TPA: 30S ribosomal protein S8 [Flavobacteriales bacterium]|nr:30S ribosomal protein S8 [Flavobacteriales bacterium]|tara:strand:+ start:617 stop:1015 length:399 start_codon:yes stop_codon:yes gene_type:complete
MNTDPIADYLTRVRNAQMAGHKVVEIPASNMKKEMTRILFDKGYILNYKFDDAGYQGTIKIALRYDSKTKRPAITELQRVSTPGLRLYAGSGDIPRVLNGLGVCIVSTSKGLMTDKEARKMNIGGEVICTVY